MHFAWYAGAPVSVGAYMLLFTGESAFSKYGFALKTLLTLWRALGVLEEYVGFVARERGLYNTWCVGHKLPGVTYRNPTVQV